MGKGQLYQQMVLELLGVYILKNKTKQKTPSPGQVTQLVGVLSHVAKGCGFDPKSGNIPRLQILSLLRVHIGPIDGSHIHLSLSLSLPPPFLSLSNQ